MKLTKLLAVLGLVFLGVFLVLRYLEWKVVPGESPPQRTVAAPARLPEAGEPGPVETGLTEVDLRKAASEFFGDAKGSPGDSPVASAVTQPRRGILPPIKPRKILPKLLKLDCRKITAASTIDSYGGIWNILNNPIPVGPEWSAMRKKIPDYFACKAIADGDASLCEVLRGALGKSLADTCRGVYRPLWEDQVIRAYVSSLVKKEKRSEPCREMFKEQGVSEMVNIGEKQFCQLLYQAYDRGDLSSLCSVLFHRGFFISGSREVVKECGTVFPSNLSDCGGSADCKQTLEMIAALRSGKPPACPSGYSKALCRALRGGVSKKACARIGVDLTRLYCASLARGGGDLKTLSGVDPDVDDLNRKIREMKRRQSQSLE